MFHINIQGLKNKTHQLAIGISKLDPQILIISEHNLSMDNLNKICLPRYRKLNSFSRGKTKAVEV